MKGLLACILSGVLGLIGCAPKKMPEGDLIRLTLTRSGTMSGFKYEGRVTQDSTGAFVLRAMKENFGDLYEKRIDAEAMNRFRQIIEEEKMYKYKESYTPWLKILDGWGWSFTAAFSNGTEIKSYGSNAHPRGNGLERIRGYMDELIIDGVKVE